MALYRGKKKKSNLFEIWEQGGTLYNKGIKLCWAHGYGCMGRRKISYGDGLFV